MDEIEKEEEGMGNEEMEKSQERGEEAKDMLNGVGGLNVWWSLVVHPDESRKTR